MLRANLISWLLRSGILRLLVGLLASCLLRLLAGQLLGWLFLPSLHSSVELVVVVVVTVVVVVVVVLVVVDGCGEVPLRRPRTALSAVALARWLDVSSGGGGRQIDRHPSKVPGGRMSVPVHETHIYWTRI